MSIRQLSDVSDLREAYDILIVGAGPAGMAAAIRSADAGARVVVLDENPRVGGQIYRDITRNEKSKRGFLGKDYWKGRPIAERFGNANADYAPRATVWSVERRLETPAVHLVGLTIAGRARTVEASSVILATGAQERPMAVPGWTLPGVMTAGAAQIALKSAAAIPGSPVVLAGNGPLLYLLAGQLIDAGTSDVTLLDTSASAMRWSALRYLPGFALSPYALKGMGLLLKVRSAARVCTAVEAISIGGQSRVQEVSFTSKGRTRTVPARTVLLHQGVIPSINLTSAAGCDVVWSDSRRAFEPVVDVVGRTSQPGIYVTGDGAAIAGAQAAEVSGRIVATGALADLGLTGANEGLSLDDLLAERKRFLRGRAFLDELYAVRPQFRAPPDLATIVCRCEEISAGSLRAAIALGPPGPNQLKTFLRCGMGQCQGRLCAATVTEVLAAERKVSPAEIGTYRTRSPVKPIRLSELACLAHTPRALAAATGRDPVDHDESG